MNVDLDPDEIRWLANLVEREQVELHNKLGQMLASGKARDMPPVSRDLRRATCCGGGACRGWPAATPRTWCWAWATWPRNWRTATTPATG